MIALIKALLLGIALVAGAFAVPVVMALLLPVISFAAIVLGIWFIARIVAADDQPPSDPPP